MKRSTTIPLTILSCALTLATWTSAGSAMPIFARKYGFKCSYCHTTIPRLNETGFRFRAAGFRLPSDIGTQTDENYQLGNYLAVALTGAVNDAATNPPDAASTSTLSMGLDQIMVAVAGAMTPDMSADVHLMYDPMTGLFGLDKAYAQYTTGAEDGFFTAKLGVLDPLQGYQASDEAMGNSDPLIRATTAIGPNGSTLFTTGGLPQFGLELGYTWPTTAVRATVSGGVYSDGQGGVIPVEGTAGKPAGPSQNSVDMQVFITQFLNKEGAGLSGYLYYGSVDLPTSSPAPDTLFQDKYLRYAIYGTLPISSFQILAGFQQGTDNSWDTAKLVKGSDFTNSGWFGEADYQIAPLFGVGARYDQFVPWTQSSDNAINAIAGFVNYAFGNGLQVVGEYQSITTQQGPGVKETDGNFGINVIWIH
ncbi:MAG TPA: hypothetical protein VFH95_04990 [Candidatus Kapabacteria bacterium]|nr:hypothetical protein [Candidatus Kapabacteria bacterium]